MLIERLHLRHFRNLAAVDLVVHSPVVVLQGDNAQGKTNILEALYLCATGRSFRQATAVQMCMHQSLAGSATAHFVREGVRHEVAVLLRGKQRLLRIDGRAMRQATQLLQWVNIVAFFPDDLRIIKGSPEERRRFLDRAVANSAPAFVEATLAYYRALRSRNALLRGVNAPDRSQVQAYDTQLVRFGSVMHACRQATLHTLLPTAREHFAALMPHAKALHVALHSGVPGATDDDMPEALAAALGAGYARDRARGMTLVGPHRADLLCQIGDEDTRLFASQGQQRALVLALKLAEVVCLRARLGSPPILILDDVSSELDAERTRRLFEVVQSVQSQVWVSTTGAVPLPVPPGAQRFTVRNGQVGVQQGSGASLEYGASA
jgi:DNA replication and repair protein RecF